MGARSSGSYRIRGLIALYQLQYDRAVDELERGAALAPSDAETHRRLAVAYVIRGRTDDALKAAMHALADDPRNVDSYTVLGLIQHLREEQQRVQGKGSADEYREALQTIEQGIRYAPDKGKYMSEEYADLLHYTHQQVKAAQILEDRVVQTQHYTDYYNLGRLYQTVGRAKQQWEEKLQNAKTRVEETIAATPLDARAYSYLALIETRLGAFKNAGEASARARQLAPLDLDVLYNTARMFALQTDKTQALDYLSKAVDRRYRLSSILDMDLYNLRSEPEFQQAVTR
jgi:Flp pilus assembly protein TadD